MKTSEKGHLPLPSLREQNFFCTICSILSKINHRLQLAKQRHQLQYLTKSQLQDIGVSAEDAKKEAQKGLLSK